MTATLPTTSTTSSCPFGSAVKATSGQDWAGEIEASGCVARRSQRFFLRTTHDTDTFTTPPSAQVTNLSRPPAWATYTSDQQRNGETIPKPSLSETRRAAKKAPDDYSSSEGIGGDPDVHHIVGSIDRNTQHGWKQPSVSYVADCEQTINRPSQTCLTGNSTGTTPVLPTIRKAGITPLYATYGSWGITGNLHGYLRTLLSARGATAHAGVKNAKGAIVEPTGSFVLLVGFLFR